MQLLGIILGIKKVGGIVTLREEFIWLAKNCMAKVKDFFSKLDDEQFEDYESERNNRGNDTE